MRRCIVWTCAHVHVLRVRVHVCAHVCLCTRVCISLACLRMCVRTRVRLGPCAETWRAEVVRQPRGQLGRDGPWAAGGSQSRLSSAERRELAARRAGPVDPVRAPPGAEEGGHGRTRHGRARGQAGSRWRRAGRFLGGRAHSPSSVTSSLPEAWGPGDGVCADRVAWTPCVGSGLCGGGVSVAAQRQRPRAGVLQEFADAVSQLVTQKFRELTAGLAAAHTHHRALAGIVMTTGNAARPAAGLPSAGRGHHRALPSLRGPGRTAWWPRWCPHASARLCARSSRSPRRQGDAGLPVPGHHTAHLAARPGTAGATARPGHRGAAAAGGQVSVLPSLPRAGPLGARNPIPGGTLSPPAGCRPPGCCPRNRRILALPARPPPPAQGRRCVWGQGSTWCPPRGSGHLHNRARRTGGSV